MTITSNTIVRNGMPFIGKVLRQVAPFMDKMIITISVNSKDGTIDEIIQVAKEYPEKVMVLFENVSTPKELTRIRNEQVRITTTDWILFLDDDDYWTEEELKKCLNELDKDNTILSYFVNPYQMVDFQSFDTGWKNRYFAKFLRRDGLKFIHPFPKDVPADKDGRQLFWKKHPQTKRLPYRFYHLQNLKSGSFRTESWAQKYKTVIKKILPLENKLVI